MKFTLPTTSILFFDIEVRPTAWIGGDYVGRSLTAYAFMWDDGGDTIHASAISRTSQGTASLASELACEIEAADLVVGHYIRGFDLPVLNAELERNELPMLRDVLTIDTKLDRKMTSGISESLENLGYRHGLPTAKHPMSEPWWEEFNLWQTPESRRRVIDRVSADVKETRELYHALHNQDYLRPPKVWSSNSARMPRYRA